MVDCVYNFRWDTDQKNKLFKSYKMYKKDVQYAEINEKSIFSFWDMVDCVLKFKNYFVLGALLP